MSQPDDRTELQLLEQYVTTASGALGVPIDRAWVPAIAQNLKLLLASATTAQLDTDFAAEPAPRFEP